MWRGVDMGREADVLWRINHEYRKRLSLAQTRLGLLEELVLDSPAAEGWLEGLRWARQQVEAVVDDLRAWRGRYYYADSLNRRMVQHDGAVYTALQHFDQIRGDHELRLQQVYGLFVQGPRPDPELTRVPQGDLWELAFESLYDLLTFNDYLLALHNA